MEPIVNGRKGFLMVTMEPPPAMEEEFNDWYDAEHLPDRAGMPGFESARRFVCVAGWPRYFTFYDLRVAGVMGEPAYVAASGDRHSPWTKRILKPVRGQWRATGEQIYPGAAPMGNAARVLMLRFRRAPASAEPVIVGGIRARFEGMANVLQVRVFNHPEPGSCEYIALIEAASPLGPEAVDGAALGHAAAWLYVVNEYAPYWTRGHLPGVCQPGTR